MKKNWMTFANVSDFLVCRKERITEIKEKRNNNKKTSYTSKYRRNTNEKNEIVIFLYMCLYFPFFLFFIHLFICVHIPNFHLYPKYTHTHRPTTKTLCTKWEKKNSITISEKQRENSQFYFFCILEENKKCVRTEQWKIVCAKRVKNKKKKKKRQFSNWSTTTATTITTAKMLSLNQNSNKLSNRYQNK